MNQLTIIEDDSPLQHTVRRAFLSEEGWEICDEQCDPRSEMAVIDFPASNASPQQQQQRQGGRPPFVVIKVDKRSRLLSYESHFVEPVAEVAPRVRAAVVHVLPPENHPQAESLCYQLSVVENQDQEFYEVEEPDAICVAAHHYRQRRRQDILAELIELKDYGTHQ